VTLLGANGVTVGGDNNVSVAQGNKVDGNGLGIYVTSIPTLSDFHSQSFPGCELGSSGNSITNNSVTSNTLFGIDIDGQTSLPELVSEEQCGSDLNNKNVVNDNIVTGNGLLGNAEGVYGADIADFSNYNASTYPNTTSAPPFKLQLAVGTQATGCSGETPCTWTMQVYDADAGASGEKIPEGTQFTIGTCVTNVSGSCITAYVATTPSGFQTVSNQPLAPSTITMTGEAGALSSLTTPVTGNAGTVFLSNFEAGVTNALANSYSLNVCTNGLTAPTDAVANSLTTQNTGGNFESGSTVFNTATATAPYDAC
jgi:fluoride ion exporter CrcB/FEX